MNNSSLFWLNNTYYDHRSVRFNYDIQFSVAIFLAVLTTLFSFMTVVCNVILISVIIRTPSLHTKTNMMLLSVAGSELATGAFVMPFIAAIWFNKTLLFSIHLCSFIAFMTSLTTSLKSLGMLSLSVDRCLAVSHPLQYTSYITKSTTVMFVVCVWSVSVLFAMFPYFGIGRYIFVAVYGRCMLDIENSVTFTIVKEVTCTILPAIVILITLLIILVEAKSHHRVITIAQLAIAMYSGPAALPGINYSRSTFKAMRTYLIITCIYLFTCFPKSLYVISATGHSGKRSNETFIVLTLMSFICCISTPLVITTLNKKFKQSVKAMFERRNKIKPLTEAETYTISTGLHSILEKSMVFPCVPSKDSLQIKRESRDEPIPGPSGYVSGHLRGQTSVRFTQRKVSILHEMQSFSSVDLPSTCAKSAHGQLQKSLSSPS